MGGILTTTARSERQKGRETGCSFRLVCRTDPALKAHVLDCAAPGHVALGELPIIEAPANNRVTQKRFSGRSGQQLPAHRLDRRPVPKDARKQRSPGARSDDDDAGAEVAA